MHNFTTTTQRLKTCIPVKATPWSTTFANPPASYRSLSGPPGPKSCKNLKKSGARGPPQFLKKRSENAGANENISGGFAAIAGIAPRVAPRIVGFVLIKSWEAIPRMEFRIPRMEFPIPRAAPRIPRNSPRAPRMAFSLRERFSWNWGGPQASEKSLLGPSARGSGKSLEKVPNRHFRDLFQTFHW